LRLRSRVYRFRRRIERREPVILQVEAFMDRASPTGLPTPTGSSPNAVRGGPDLARLQAAALWAFVYPDRPRVRALLNSPDLSRMLPCPVEVRGFNLPVPVHLGGSVS
jgi:hypothetical protein